MKVVIVDYGVGNIRSLTNAFEHIGCDVELTRDPVRIFAADRLILPGVGSFPYCMEKLKEYELDKVIKAYVSQGKPMLGICVGMQMLFDFGEEHGGAEGLGIIPGRVIHFSRYAEEKKLSIPERLPHIAWSAVNWSSDVGAGQLFSTTALSGFYYFVHSFVCVPDNAMQVLATTSYAGLDYCSMAIKGKVCGVQFHPEKSGVLGLSLLKAFVFN
jgi:imidazole glycerol-phosphate synthase subunit HisH